MTYISPHAVTKPQRSDEEILRRIAEIRAQRFPHLAAPAVKPVAAALSSEVAEKRETIQDLARQLRDDENAGIDFSDFLKGVSDSEDGEEGDGGSVDPEIAELLKNLHKK